MPYIAKIDRVKAEHFPENGGELNFAVSKLITAFIHRNGLNYQNISDIIGALEGAKAEFQRRVVGPYEDVKILQNGDLEEYALIEESIAMSNDCAYMEANKRDG